MKIGNDELESGFERKMRMIVKGNEEKVIGKGEKKLIIKGELDEIRVERKRLVNRIVDELGKKVVKWFLVSEEDINEGEKEKRIKELKKEDGGGVVIVEKWWRRRRIGRGRKRIGRGWWRMKERLRKGVLKSLEINMKLNGVVK